MVFEFCSLCFPGGGGGLSTQDTQALETALQQAASSRDSGTSTSSSLIQFINTAYSLLNNADANSPGEPQQMHHHVHPLAGAFKALFVVL